MGVMRLTPFWSFAGDPYGAACEIEFRKETEIK